MAVLWYDKDNQEYMLPNTVCDAQQAVVTAVIAHVSTYMIADKKLLRGTKYYIDFDEYLSFIKKYSNPIFSNILYMEKK